MALAPGLRKRGLFGSSTTAPPAPEIGDGMTAQPNVMAAPKPAFFGEGGVGRAIAGNIGDFLLQYSGMNPIYAPAMQQRQALEQDETQRRNALADWVWKQRYEAEHRPPTAPHYWETNNGSLGMVGPDGAPKIVYQDPDEKIQWMQVDNGDGTKTVVPYNSKGPLSQQAPQRPVGRLSPYSGGVPPVSAAPRPTNAIARSAYEAFVTQFGKDEADAILKRNGLTVGNF